MKTKILFLITLLSLSSCYYYRVIPEKPDILQSEHKYEDSTKIMILHRGESAWHLSDVQIIDNSLKAKIDTSLGFLNNYLDPKEKGLNPFKKAHRSEVLNSVHLYTTDTTFNDQDTQIAIPISSVYEVSSYEYARAASRASIIVPAVLIPIFGVVLFAVVSVSQADYGLYSFY